ncbi:MAG: hypothetical protein HC802_08940 [Caldilineaceae bacterium]|nr:hypothetical protein [Caldilineaceae bacterium]
MTDHRLNDFLWAVGAIGAGSLLLLFNFDLLSQFEPLAQFILAGFCAVAGVGFVVGYLSGRANWWRLIPAWTLFALSGMVFLSTFPDVDPRLIAALLFVGLALAFAHIYLLDRSNAWWAIIRAASCSYSVW